MLAKPDPPEYRLRIEVDDFLRRAAGIKRQQDGDQAAHDVSVAVAPEDDALLAVSNDLRDQPYLAGAAAHLGRFVVLGGRQPRQRLPELYHIAVAVLPIIEVAKVLYEGVDGCLLSVHGTTHNTGGVPPQPCNR